MQATLLSYTGALRTGGPGAAAGSDCAAGSAGAAPSGEASGSAPAPKAKVSLTNTDDSS